MRRLFVSRAEQGEGKLPTVGLLAAVVAAVYFGIMYVPVYAEKWDVKSNIQRAANETWKFHDRERTYQRIVESLKAYNVDGKEPLFLLDTENLVVDDDETTKRLTIRVTWTRIIPYPFLKKRTQKVFTQEYSMGTEDVKW